MCPWQDSAAIEAGTPTVAMQNIHILEDRLVSQIAAGEVVERPASVVKELIENALDAGAAAIKIELEEGGRKRIRVLDDGSGMSSEDALLAFDRHATSKISTFDDLQRVGTLGFRGEALSSIAAVAQVEMRTAAAPGEGHKVRIEGGRVMNAEPVAYPQGTSLEVESLFFNVPARRKFLKSARTELRRTTEVVQGYALTRPEVGFTLFHEGRLLLETTPGPAGPAGARERIAEIFGGKLADSLVEIEPAGTGEELIWGFVGDTSTVRGRRYFTFVNRRLLRDRALMATFYRAVREEWKSEEFPALFLFLDLPAESIDVNVHPQKAEIRFRDNGPLDRLSLALRQTLGEALGEAAAPLRQPLSVPSVPFVWQGIGGSEPEGSELREGGFWGARSSPVQLADVVYSPGPASPVPLSGRSAEPRRLRLLGQYKGSLILLEGPESLFLIDQHAAHERILYERLRRATLAETVAVQALVEPLVMELGSSEAMRMAELQPHLEECGFSLTELSGNSWALREAPAMLTPDEAHGLLFALSTEGELGEAEIDVRDRLLHALSASMSCKAAIKIHHPLTTAEMEALVQELFDAEQPYACPHGRPVVLEMTDRDLERRFGRR